MSKKDSKYDSAIDKGKEEDVMNKFMKMFKDYIAFHPEEFRASDKKPTMNRTVVL